MTTINDVIKINALLSLLFGAILVFMPETITTFLSDSQTAPKLLPVFSGVTLNLYGLLLLWLASKNPVPQLPLLLVIIVNFLWIVAIVLLIKFELWITSINGITIAGLIAILVGWLSWVQLKQYLANKA